MPFISEEEGLRLKLASMPRTSLGRLCSSRKVISTGRIEDLVKKLINSNLTSAEVDLFIKREYTRFIQEREALISTDELKQELMKVTEYFWGTVQGELDNRIQNEFVRRYVRYDELVATIRQRLHDAITSYTICSWYNHWTTVLIEEYISQHPRVVPVLKRIKGIDIFFGSQPFDLKITYLPAKYNFHQVEANPKDLIVWLYENQGALRFGADNRLFVVLHDTRNPADSWALKRDFILIQNQITQFLDSEKVDIGDEVMFLYDRKTYTAISKLLMVVK